MSQITISPFYRQALADQGLAQSALYNGDPGMDTKIQTLLTAAGQGPVYDEKGPRIPIPGRVVPIQTDVLPNAATVSPSGTVSPGVTTTTAPAAPDDSAASGLSLKGVISWAKANPAKAVGVGIVAALVLHELLFKKGRK